MDRSGQSWCLSIGHTQMSRSRCGRSLTHASVARYSTSKSRVHNYNLNHNFLHIEARKMILVWCHKIQLIVAHRKIYNLFIKVSFIQKFYRLSLNLSKNLSFVPKPVQLFPSPVLLFISKISFIRKFYRLSRKFILYPEN